MTVFITISRGIIARNLLQNDFFRLVKGRFSKVVLITTAADDERFKREFAAPNVAIVPMPRERDTFLGMVFEYLYLLLIFNQSTVGHGLYRYAEVPSRGAWIVKYVRFALIRLVFQPLSALHAVRRFLQWLDYRFLQRESVEQYERLIAEYQPDAILVANMLEEAALLKAARRRGIPSIGMPKTWDNPSKRYFRARADRIAAWSPFMKNEMIRLHDYRDSEVAVIGIPQFDYYTDRSRHESREDFCARVGLDPEKKIICIGSEGKIMPSDVPIAHLVHDDIRNSAFAHQCQLFIRPHYAHPNEEHKFDSLKGLPGVVIDTYNQPSEGFGDHWDYSKEQMDHFLSILRHSDVIINSASTLTLDAAAMGTPVVLVTFDGRAKKPFYASSARWYVCDYYREVLKYNSARMAHNPESLRAAIDEVLARPEFLADNQRRLCERLCYRIDGNAGARLSEELVRSASGN